MQKDQKTTQSASPTTEEFIENSRRTRIGESMSKSVNFLRNGHQQAREAVHYLRGEEEKYAIQACKEIAQIIEKLAETFKNDIDKVVEQ